MRSATTWKTIDARQSVRFRKKTAQENIPPAVQERLRLLESVVVHANDVILITEAEPIDLPGPRVIYVNPAFTRMTGYEPQDILGKTPRLLQGPETDPQTRQYVRNCLSQRKPFLVELLNYRKDGTSFWVELNVQPVADESGWYTHWIAVQRDISERKQREAEKERQQQQALERAERDPLTGLWNCSAFHRRYEQQAKAMLEQNRTLGVVLLDVENFVYFNELYGYAVGDAVLLQIAAHLQKHCPPDSTLARIGGDEFALLLPDVSLATRDGREEGFRDLFCGVGYNPPAGVNTIPITLSVGIGVFPTEGQTPIEVYRAADQRLKRNRQGTGASLVTENVRQVLVGTVPDFAMLDALVSAVDNKDRYTRRHSEDVLIYSLMIAAELQLPEAERHWLMVAALIHDVGKIGVPDYILRMPGKLSPDEYSLIKQHVDLGVALIKSVHGLEPTIDAIQFHHERWDGSGYPHGLQAEAIPLAGRILAVADTFSALTTDRPYRLGMEITTALEVLEKGAGRFWDANCVAALKKALLRDSCELSSVPLFVTQASEQMPIK